MLKLLDIIDKGVGLSEFLSLIILVIPSLLFVILPIVVFLAALYTYNRFGEERQLNILKSVGISNFELVKPALIAAGLVTIFAYYVSAELMPLSYNKLKSRLNLIRNSYAINIINERSFTKISKLVTLYVDKKSGDGGMNGLVLFDNTVERNPVILLADYGKFEVIDNRPLISLKDGIRYAFDDNANLVKLRFEVLKVFISNKILPTENYNRDVNEHYIHELLNPGNKLSPQKQTRLKAEAHQRLIWPIYNIMLAYIALAVFLKVPYSKKFNFRRVLLSSLAVTVFAAAHFTFQNMAGKDIRFIMACYGNVIVGFAFASWFIRKSV